WLSEPGNSDGAPGLLRHGAGRALFQERGLALPPYWSSSGRHRAARGDCDGDRSLRALRADIELRHLRRFHLLWTDGCISVCLPAEDNRFVAATLSHARPPLYHRTLCT